MTELTKLTLKTVKRVSKSDPTQQRRAKLVVAIEEQVKVLAAALKGETHMVRAKGWAKNEQGEKVAIEKMRQVRAWFFEQDSGWYVQCRYGSKVLDLGNGNAVFVKTLKEVETALSAFLAAARSGELDAAIEAGLNKRKAA
ncbi:hypothetical protein L0666_06535 [Octadecabacter sp. CECT 8868]|uniref:hypothetical protein n=1 Tax=Octadecabacter algicola TaxID=2909342 RepID=UPI001F1EEC33|nr:hypothetical protein [Octadecabacter algicola]MCF2904636.1 hypothetical protein [Octadecabacter algicola]